MFGSRKRRALAQQRAAELQSGASEPESEEESEDNISHSDDAREHVERVESHSGESSQQSRSAVLDGGQPQQNQPEPELPPKWGASIGI